MRKKWIIIAVLTVFIVAAVGLLFKTGKKYINASTKATTVTRGVFQKNYVIKASVESKRHHQFFSGYINSLHHDIGELVEEGTVILEYTDAYNRKQQLKSPVKGYVTDISSGCVIISDTDYYLIAQLPQEVMSLVEKDAQCLFVTENNEYLVTVTDRNMYGINAGGRTLFQLKLSVENRDTLYYGQKGTLTIPLMNLHGVLTVDRKAIYETREGFYLLPSGWLSNNADPIKSLIRIEVLDANEKQAVINGVAIEDLEVCLIDDMIRELLGND